MTANSQSLNELHDVIERQLAAAVAAANRKDWATYRARFFALREALLEHIAYEDEELYPQVEKAGFGAGELDELRREHGYFRELLEALGAAAPEHDPEGCIAELEKLAVFLHVHHARETNACYGHADTVPVAAPPKPPSEEAAPATLDLRGLQPPEPIVRIFQALERSPNEPVRAILPHEPVPLYGLLRERGFGWAGTQRTDGGFELLIRKA